MQSLSSLLHNKLLLSQVTKPQQQGCQITCDMKIRLRSLILPTHVTRENSYYENSNYEL